MSVVGAGVALAIRGQVNAAAEVGRFAQVANTNVEQFQRMAAGARTVGIEQEKLSDILKDVNDRVGDFLQTGGGPMADFFESIAPQIGVTADMFRDISGADALQLYVSSLEAANLSQAEMTFYLEAMASDTTALIPLLANGGAGMQRLGDAAAAAGGIMSSETVAAAREFQQQLSQLGAVMTGIVRQIMAALLPVLTQITELASSAALSFAELSPRMQTFSAAVAGITIVAGPALIAMGAIIRALGLIKIALIAATGPWGVLAGLVIAAAGYFLLFRDNAEPAQTAAEETALAMEALNTAMGTFHTSAGPATAQAAVNAANGLRLQAASARDAAASTLALIEAQNAEAEQRLADGGGVMPFGTALGESNRLAAQVELDRARASLFEAEAAANRSIQEVTSTMATATTATGELANTTHELSVSLNTVGGAAGGAADAVEDVTNATEDANSRLSNAAQTLTGLFMAATRGAASARQALGQLLSRMAEALANRAFMALLGGGKIGGSGLGGFLTRLLSFSGGGYTGNGSRTGGLDGQGGFLAMMHPQETVTDHRSGPAGAMSVSIGFDASAGGFTAYVKDQAGKVLASARPQIVSDAVGATYAAAREVPIG